MIGWLIITFIGGSLFGTMIMALLNAAKSGDAN